MSSQTLVKFGDQNIIGLDPENDPLFINDSDTGPDLGHLLKGHFRNGFQIDTVATELHLPVFSSAAVDIAGLIPKAHVSGAIHSFFLRPGRKRILRIFSLCDVGHVKVTRPDLDSRNIDVSSRSGRLQLEMVIENVNPRAWEWRPYVDWHFFVQTLQTNCDRGLQDSC